MKVNVPKVISLLRRRIRNMSPGEALPGIRVLMNEYGVSQSLIQQAFVILKQEKLIEAHNGSGTYVTEKATLQKVLWVCGIDTYHGDISSYYNHLLQCCNGVCAERNLSMDHLWLSNQRTDESIIHCVPDIFDRYKGFIFSGCSAEHPLLNYIKQNRVPFVDITHYLSASSHRVVKDLPYILRTGFSYFASIGHREVVYIDCEDSIYEGIRYEAAASAGIELLEVFYQRQIWTADMESQAYLVMRKYIKDNGLPKAIFVHDDIAARGVTRAIIELCSRKKVKDCDIIIVTSRQTIMPLGVDAVYLVMNIEESAQHAVDILYKQFDGCRIHEMIVTLKCKLMTCIDVNKVGSGDDVMKMGVSIGSNNR